MLAALMTILTGCSGAFSQKPGEGEEGAGKNRLVIWCYYETQEQQESLDRLVEMFNESQGRYEASWEYHGPAIEFNKQLALAMTEKEMPDLVIVDQSDMQDYIHKDLLEDITSYVEGTREEEEYYEAAMQSVKYNGKYYGLPFCANTVALIYNKEMLAEAGLEAPETISEFLTTAKALADGETYGFAMSAVTGAQSSFQILPWILSEGDELNQLGGEGTEAAFEVIRKLIESEAMPKECINWSPNDVARGFLSGQYAMMENTMDVVPLLEEAGMQAGIVKLPRAVSSKSVAGGESIGIIQGKDKDGALAFLDFFRQEDVMEEILGPQFGLPAKKELAQKRASQYPQYKVFEEVLEDSVSRSSYSKWPGVSETLSESLTQVILEQMTPRQAAERLKSER